jgi:hypothetical protein
MAQRLQLQALLETLGPEKVYFQSPSEDKMVYPCILYSIDEEAAKYADNNPYSLTFGYQVTVIDRNPDSVIPKKVARLPMSSYRRFFVVDGLNHTVYRLFF